MTTNPFHQQFTENHLQLEPHQQPHQLAMMGAIATSSPASDHDNKLQSQKSSFQAWKCVSFGCSLLAILLLLSKWYEVSTDLHLLLGIDRLLSTAASMAPSTNGSNLSWPPVPLDQLLPAPNETNFGMESMESNETMLMSHMQMSLNRELNGNTLLRQEVDAFIDEFRTAKSTLGLSSLLVSVYILSWILMTLAINDTRISNDISLRNILLLSVFGAIDMAASIGFVMVRLVMYSVKNNSFVSQMLDSNGLKDTQIRLSADQLTAFTALRLIAMRSCSAYVDAYVSILVALLTILRLYAILRALSYYRRLRRVSDTNQKENLLDLDQAKEHQQQLWSSFLTSPFIPSHQLISPPSRPVALPDSAMRDISSHPAGSYNIQNSAQHMHEFKLPGGLFMGPNGHKQAETLQHQYTQQNKNQQQETSQLGASKSSMRHFRQQQSGSMPTSKLIFKDLVQPSPTFDESLDEAQVMMQLSQQHQQTTKSTRTNRTTAPNTQLLIMPDSQQPRKTCQSTLVAAFADSSRSRSRSRSQSRQNNSRRSGSSNLLLVNGKTHRLVAGENSGSHSEPIKVDQVSNSEHNHKVDTNTSLPAGINFRKLNELQLEDSPDHLVGSVFTLTGKSNKSSRSLLDEEQRTTKPKQQQTKRHNELLDTFRSNGTTYTLLSASQLEKLTRKLEASSRNTTGKAAGSKFRLIQATSTLPHQQVAKQTIRPSSSSGKRDSGLANDFSSSLNDSCSSAQSETRSSSSDNDSDCSLPVRSRRQRKNARLLGVRQTEEQLVASSSAVRPSSRHQQYVNMPSLQNSALLLEKYYYA